MTASFDRPFRELDCRIQDQRTYCLYGQQVYLHRSRKCHLSAQSKLTAAISLAMSRAHFHVDPPPSAHAPGYASHLIVLSIGCPKSYQILQWMEHGMYLLIRILAQHAGYIWSSCKSKALLPALVHQRNSMAEWSNGEVPLMNKTSTWTSEAARVRSPRGALAGATAVYLLSGIPLLIWYISQGSFLLETTYFGETRFFEQNPPSHKFHVLKSNSSLCGRRSGQMHVMLGNTLTVAWVALPGIRTEV